jgi:hypothetical protein
MMLPNTRMLPDAAPRPQDQADFRSSFGLKVISIYRRGAADARGVGRQPVAVRSRSRDALEV